MSEPTGVRRYGTGGGDAYYDAVKYGGYEGTREQFGKDQAEFATNATAVAAAKEVVEQDTKEVRSTKETFVNTTVPEAITAIQQEGTTQVQAVTQQGEESSQQVEAVGTQWKDEVANEGRARVQAVEQAGTNQVQAVNDAGTAQVGAVNQAGADQVAAVDRSGVTQVQAVTDEGTTQITAVKDAGAAERTAIEEKGEQTRESIPDDYTALSDEVDNLNRQISDVEDTSIEDYNKEELFEDVTATATKSTGHYIRSNGNEGTSSLWNYYRLSVASGEKYNVSAYQSDSIKSCMFLDSSNAVLAYYPSEEDTTLKRYSFEITVPNNAVTLIVNERTGSNYIASVIEKFTNYSYQHTDEYNSWKSEQNGIRSPSEITVSVDSADITEKTGYYIGSNGAEAESSLWRIMSLTVSAGEKYNVTAQFYGNIKGVFFYDENDAFISPYYGNENDDALHTLDVVVPQNAVIMRINDKKSNGFEVLKYIRPINNDYIIVNGKTLEDIVNGFGTSGNVLYGKTLVTVGDSITYGADMDAAGIAPDGALMTYGWQIANRNSMTFYNRGVSGSTVAAGTNRNGFAEPNGRYTQLPDSIDYLTIWFGWNDYACITDSLETLGTIDSTDINSYYGAYNTVLPYLINKYPNTRIGLVVPFGANAAIRQAVRDLAAKWGLGYFDNYTENTPLYYGKENMDVLAEGLAVERRALWQANGAHPNYAGHCQLSTQIEAWLRTL